jgi:hypothetical protein
MVTHSSTSRPVQCLCMAERTGCPVLTDLWSYVSFTLHEANRNLGSGFFREQNDCQAGVAWTDLEGFASHGEVDAECWCSKCVECKLTF